MSKGGAQRAAKKREVMARIEEAAEKKLLEDTIDEQQAKLQKLQRVQEVFWRCKHAILNNGGFYGLPGEVIGAEIAESMMRQAYQRMLEQAMAQRGLSAAGDEVKPGDIRVASPLIVPG